MNPLAVLSLVLAFAPEQLPDAPSPVAALSRALQDRNFTAVDEAIRAVSQGKETGAAVVAIQPALIAADPAIRRLAAYALSEIDSEAARQQVPALCAALRDREPRVRARVALALGNIGPAAREAAPLLMDLLSDEDGRVRAGSARALGLIGADSQPAIPKLIELLKDPEPPVRGLAAFALGQMAAAAKSAVPALTTVQITDPEPSIRQAAATAIEAIDPPLTVLLDALESRDETRRLWAVSILTQRGPAARPAVAPLLALLKSDDSAKVRAGAALAVGKIGADARAAGPVLIQLLRDREARVRTAAALALGLLRPEVRDAARPLAAALRDTNEEAAAAAATALGNLGAAVEPAVPLLRASLKDADVIVRRRAVNVLARIGPAAKLAIDALLPILSDADTGLRHDAFRALISCGPQPKAPLMALREALEARDDELGPHVRAWACLSLGEMGPKAAEAITPLLAALQDDDANVRTSATLALGRIGAPAIAELVNALDHLDSHVRCGAALALGIAGPASRRALPKLHTALRDEDASVSLAVALALGRIAGGLQAAQQTQELEILEETRSVLDSARPALLSAEQAAQWQMAVEQVREAIQGLQTVRRARFFESLVHSPWFRWLAGGTLYVGVLLAGWFTLLRVRPLLLLRINDALRSVPHIHLPSLLGNMEVSLSTLLLVRWFHYHPRVLDAWIGLYLADFREHYEGKRTVVDRRVYVPVPVVLDGKVVAGATAQDLGRPFARARGCLLIWGEGGAGKTSLACQLGHWAMAEDRAERLCKHLMLPVLIEHELDLNIAGGKPAFTALTEAVRGQIQALIGDATLSEELLDRLLRQRRILVIVDHFSEISGAARDAIRPGSADFPAHALVVTSRREETLDDVPRSVVQPLRIEGNRLSSFMEAYLVQRSKRELFHDSEYFEACRRLSLLVGGQEITVLLAKLYAEQMIAQKERGATNAPPTTLPDLMMGYLNELNRAVGKEERHSDFEVQRDAGILAWECLRQRLRPGTAGLDNVLEALGGPDARQRLQYLSERLRLVRTAEPAPDQVAFTLDPLAEYLAAMYLVNRNRGNANFWRDFMAQVDEAQAGQGICTGFLHAVQECCKLREPGAAVIEGLSKRLAQAA